MACTRDVEELVGPLGIGAHQKVAVLVHAHDESLVDHEAPSAEHPHLPHRPPVRERCSYTIVQLVHVALRYAACGGVNDRRSNTNVLCTISPARTTKCSAAGAVVVTVVCGQ